EGGHPRAASADVAVACKDGTGTGAASRAATPTVREGESGMQPGMVGLGRMGANLVRRLIRAGHECVVYDLSEASIRQLETEGAIGSSSLDDLLAKMTPPRAVWIM